MDCVVENLGCWASRGNRAPPTPHMTLRFGTAQYAKGAVGLLSRGSMTCPLKAPGGHAHAG